MRSAALLAQAVSKSVILHIFPPETGEIMDVRINSIGGTGKCEKKWIKILESIMS